MNLVELDQALRKLRLSGMADVLDTRLQQAQTEQMAPIDLVATLVSDELQRRQDRLLARRHKQACFRDPDRSLDRFDFAFNKKIDRALVFELATARFVAQREDALLLGPPGTGKSHIAQAIVPRRDPAGLSRHLPRSTFLPRRARRGHARRHPQGLSGRSDPRAACSSSTTSACASCPTLPPQDLLELIMRRYERAVHAAHLKSTRRGLGKAARRHRRRHRPARPPAPSRARAQVRAAQLAHQGPDILARTRPHEVELNPRLGTPNMAGFAVSTNGRI